MSATETECRNRAAILSWVSLLLPVLIARSASGQPVLRVETDPASPARQQ